MSSELMDTYVCIYIHIVFIYIYKIKMAKYACFFSIILVSVFFFKTSFYTCTTYQTLKFGIEKFIP